MTSLQRPSTSVPADSDELEEQRHLETTKEVARQVIDRIFVGGEDAAIDELIAPDFTPHTFGPMPPGRDGLREGMRRAHAGVSDPEFTIHDMVAEGDRVAVRLTTSATHTGTFMGIAPTGRRYSIDEIHIFGIRDGQVAEHWHAFDRADLMAQLKGQDGGDGGHVRGGSGPHPRENRDEWDAE
jgi:predicted ester cyclase